MAEDAGTSADGPAALLRRVAGVRRTLPELQDGLFLDLGDILRKLSRFWILILLSAVIATAGVLANSTATVIGAMIVAGTIVFTLYGYRREERAARGFRRRPAFAVIAASLVLIVVPLGLTTMQRSVSRYG